MVDLSCSIAGISFDCCVMNGPGRGCISFDELTKLGKSESGAIVTTSMTLHPQEANPEPNYYEFALGSVSSMGFANLGYQKYGEILPRLKEFGKPVIASITGASLEEFVETAAYISEKKPDLIQLDFSCTDLISGRIMGYRWDLMEKILKEVRKVVRQPLGARSPVQWDPTSIEITSLVVLRTRADFLVVITPYRIGLVIDPEREKSVIKSVNSGIGQLSGSAVKPQSLANTKLYYEQLGGRIPIIGAGGINNGVDVFEYLLAGASAVQVGTAFAREGLELFPKIKAELSELMVKKGHKVVGQIVGKLKT